MLAEASRLGQIVEQEANKEDLLEQQELLEQLVSEVHIRHKQTEKV